MDFFIRNYRDTDLEAVSKLFYETVHAVNAEDYTKEQLSAWAKDEKSLFRRREDLLRQRTLVAETNGRNGGFREYRRIGMLGSAVRA